MATYIKVLIFSGIAIVGVVAGVFFFNPDKAQKIEDKVPEITSKKDTNENDTSVNPNPEDKKEGSNTNTNNAKLPTDKNNSSSKKTTPSKPKTTTEKKNDSNLSAPGNNPAIIKDDKNNIVAKKDGGSEDENSFSRDNSYPDYFKFEPNEDNKLKEPTKDTTIPENKVTTQDPTPIKTEDSTSKNETAPISDSSFDSYRKEVVRLVNIERGKVGAGNLSLDSQLSNIANKKSQDMIDKNYFDHQSPTYGSPFDMLKRFGVSYKSAGENIAMGQRTPQEVVTAWMNSKGHRENILNPSFNEIGVGIAKDSSSTIYWTQLFVGR